MTEARERLERLAEGLEHSCPEGMKDAQALRSLLAGEGEGEKAPEAVVKLADALVAAAWKWGESCGIDDISSRDTVGDSYNEWQRDNTNKAVKALLAALSSPPPSGNVVEAGRRLQAAREAHRLNSTRVNADMVRSASDAFDAALASLEGNGREGSSSYQSGLESGAAECFEIGSHVQPRGGGLVHGYIREFNADQTGALVEWNTGEEIWKALRNLEIIAPTPSPDSPRSGDGWQPIETAPKDGTEILAYSEPGCTGVMLVRHIALCDFLTDSEVEALSLDGMADEYLETADWFVADFLSGARLSPDCYPTHWRPLPAPLTQTGGDGEP